MTTGWQPIETAPLDGSRVWVRYPIAFSTKDPAKPTHYTVSIVRWSTWDNCWRTLDGGFLRVNAEDWIKHWYPFTVPPPFEEPI